ncbi:MAG TPA: lytic transglycosylase domain-containing protein [Candidatus Acidoferrales bacterium]|nr:lytic transglycosylase domain-containing protein [Candidatus Acidoferrales bacterium]
MRRHFLTILVLLAGSATVGLRPAHAQIASYVDGAGRRIYTNQKAVAQKTGAKRRHEILGPARRALPSAAQRTPVSRSQLEQIVQDRATEQGLDPRLVRAVVRTESAWNPAAISSKGAQGLMQLIPATAERFDVRDVFDPVENVEGGVRYLHELLARYDGDLAKSLAAYYAGEKRIDHAGGVPRDLATRAYVKRVTRFYLAAIDEQLPGSLPIHRFVDDEGRTIYTNQ